MPTRSPLFMSQEEGNAEESKTADVLVIGKITITPSETDKEKPTEELDASR